jgi:hypothetical protein
MICSRVKSAPQEMRRAAPTVDTSPLFEGGAAGEFEFGSDDCVRIGLEAKTDGEGLIEHAEE